MGYELTLIKNILTYCLKVFEAPCRSRLIEGHIRYVPTPKGQDLHCVPTPLDGISAAFQQASGNALVVQFNTC
ncbi:MAG: hypothetical protein C0611_05945 [Desulfobacteraceae bacterium]|nr:MAG: hypothetical protein C0611_05945 [Desulfobacteraceae bacterium]